MIKTTKNQLDVFKKEFVKWQEVLGLKDWNIFFDKREIEDGFAAINTDANGRVATVTLNSILRKEDIPDFNPKLHAKHEAIHLLLARLESLGNRRFITVTDIQEEAEAITRKLEKIL